MITAIAYLIILRDKTAKATKGSIIPSLSSYNHLIELLLTRLSCATAMS